MSNFIMVGIRVRWIVKALDRWIGSPHRKKKNVELLNRHNYTIGQEYQTI